MSSSRLFEIVYLLLERRRMTAAELADRFEVSVRTIYRDIDALSAAGIPVFAARGKGGGVALMDHFVLDRAAFSEEEQRTLLTALQSMPGSPGAAEALAKLSGLFRRQEADWLQVDLSRWGIGDADNRKFEQLKAAILERRAASFVYVSSYGKTTNRTAHPARLVFKGRSWYVQSFCPEKHAFRTFKLSRILSLRILDEHFAPLPPPPKIDGDDGSCPSPFQVRLRFSAPMAYRVYDEFDESCIRREETGALTVSVNFPEDPWLYGYLLSFGTGVEVLAPPGLRRRLGLLGKEIWQKSLKADRGCQVNKPIMETSNIQEVPTMDPINQKFCQSCGMPLAAPDDYGMEKDGSPSEHYCKYCYQDGSFAADMTMTEMIDFCVPILVQSVPGTTAEQAREQMMRYFPTLLRWKELQ